VPQFQASGAPQAGASIINYLNSAMPQMNQAGSNYASALGTAANNPGWQSAQTNAQQNASGARLAGSPEVDRALAYSRAQTMSDAANQEARIKSGYEKNGMGWSTAAQQAEQSSNATANASANATDANARMQNYLAERQNQNAAGGQLAQATGAPLNYLSQISSAYSAPMSQAAQLVAGLGSGGSIYSAGQSGTSNPSLGSSIMGGMGGL
jgi:hypothetical protein